MCIRDSTNTAWTPAQSPVVTTQTMGSGEAGADTRVTYLKTILNDVTVNGLDNIPSLAPSWAGYTYDTVKCERDTRYNLQGLDGDGGILYDLRYGGNEQTRFNASKYWINSTPQVDGDRTPEIFAKNFVRDLINNYILPQTTYPTTQSPIVTEQYKNAASTSESAAAGIVTNRFGIITDVLLNGLDNVPALERAQISSVKMQTRVPTNDLLLITDTTVNEVLFNFTDPDKGASVKYTTDEDRLTKGVEDDFPKFLERTGTITTVFLDVNTDSPAYYPKSIVQLEANKSFLQKETTAWIADKIANATTYPDAKTLIDANKEWLADEVMAWFDLTYPGVHNTTQHEKCERDTKYNIDAIAYDILHGSNTETIRVAKKYWEGAVSQLTNLSLIHI